MNEEDAGFEFEEREMDSQELEEAAIASEETYARSKKEKEYEILTLADISKLAKRLIQEVVETTGITETAAFALLHRHHFRKDRALESFFGGEQQQQQQEKTHAEVLKTCSICFDEIQHGCTLEPCSHTYCLDCLRGYITIKVKEGLTCAFTTCPALKCQTLFPQNIIRELLTEELRAKYEYFLNISVVNSLPSCKFCPTPGCDFCIQAPLGYKQPVFCTGCGKSWCFDCCDYEIGDHQPCDCDIAKLWTAKCCNESENITWIKANTKACPKCSSHIEKNGGCMTCRKCGHEFCWLCRGDWRGHSACNQESVAKLQKGAHMAKSELDHFMHFQHRYESYKAAVKIADRQAKQADERSERIVLAFNLQGEDSCFLRSAIECLQKNRAILMWSYVYGYYLSLKCNEKQAPRTLLHEKSFFEFVQKDLEHHTDRLSEAYEKEDPISKEEFITWREMIVNYTRVSIQFREKFVESVVNNVMLLPTKHELGDENTSSSSTTTPPFSLIPESEIPKIQKQAQKQPKSQAPTSQPPIPPQEPFVDSERILYRNQLEQLASMGFSDVDLLVPLLHQSNGNVTLVLNVLFG